MEAELNHAPVLPCEKNQSQQIYKDHWQSYLKLGLTPYPASRSGKNPIVPWKNDKDGNLLPPPISDDYLEWEDKYPDANLWVLIGDSFAVLDPDGPGAEDFLKSLNLPQSPIVISGNKSRHRWFKTSKPLKPMKISTNGDKTFLELRTGSLGMLVPPSKHPVTKKAYRWADGLSPWDIPFHELPDEVYSKIRDLLPRPEPRMTLSQTDSSVGRFDVERYLNYYGIQHWIKQDSDRAFYLLQKCLFSEAHTTKDIPGDSSIIQDVEGKLGYHCFHNHCFNKTWQEARQAISGNEKIAQFCQGWGETESKSRSSSEQEKSEEKKDKTHHFTLHTAKELAEMEDPNRRWLLEGTIPWAGSALVVAKPKIGKTTLSINLAVRVARGEEFLGRGTEKCNVTYLALEMNRTQIKEILRNLGATTEENLHLHCGRAPTQAMNEIRPLIQDTKANLLVIDILQKYARPRDVRDYSELTNSMEKIIGITMEEDCATVINHHLGKNDRGDGDDILGSTALLGGVDTAIIIKTIDPDRPLKKRRRVISTIQRYGDGLEGSILKMLPDGSLELSGTVKETELGEVMDLIMETLQVETKYQEKEVKALINKGSTLVSNALNELNRQGRLKKTGKGVKGKPFFYEK